MSSPPTTFENSLLDTVSTPVQYVRKPVEAVGFWSAVVLPFLYVPLFVTGLKTADARIAFASLVLLHVVALIVGRNYKS